MIPRIALRIAALLILAASALGAYWVHARSGLEFSPGAIRAQVDGIGAWAPLGFVALMAARPFLGLPSWICLMAGGLLFGAVGGTLFGAVGGTLGGLITFFVARALGRDAISGRLSGAIATVDRRIAEQGAPWLAAYTAVPASVLTPVFFAAGLSSLTVAPFTGAVALGLLPRCALYSYFGSIALDPSSGDLWIATGLVIVTLGVVWLARRALRRAVS